MNQEAALLKIPAESIDSLLVPVFDPKALKAAAVIGHGLPAGPGAATGRIAFTAATAEVETRKGNKVVLCRTETSPDDLKGMLLLLTVQNLSLLDNTIYREINIKNFAKDLQTQ